MSIRVKFIALFLAASIIPFVIIGSLVFFDFRKNLIESQIKQIDVLATLQKNRILDYIDHNNDQIVQFSTRQQLKLELSKFNKSRDQASQEKITSIIIDAKNELESFRDIHVMNNEKVIIASTDDSKIATKYEMNTGDLYKDKKNVVRIISSGQLVLSNEKIGFAVIESDTKTLFDIFKDYTGIGESGDWGLSKVSSDGVNGLVIVPSKFNKTPNAPLKATFKIDSNLPAAQAVKGHEEIFIDTVDFRGKSVISATRYLPSVGWGLVVKIDEDEVLAPIYKFQTNIIYFIALISIFIVFIGSIMTELVTKPIRALAKTANKVGGGDLSAKAKVFSNDEIGRLAQSFNDMVGKVRGLEVARDEFLSIAAHQLRTPLGTMRWNMELLLAGKIDKLSKKLRTTIEDMSENNLRLIALVNSLLDVSHINQGKINNNPEVLNPVSSIENVIKNLALETGRHSVVITIEKPKTKVPSLVLDSQLFAEVMRNILSNAIKYNKPDGKVSIRFEKAGDALQISITDTGIGIPNNDQEKVFEKFHRAQNAVHLVPNGSGLGLFVVKSYVDLWHGKVWFDSEIGKGTTFHIQIPIAGSEHE